MRIREADVSVPARGIAFGDEFFSNRMSESQLDDARRLVDAGRQTAAGSPLAASWQREAMKLAQAPHVIAANRGLGHFRSLGQNTLKSIGKLVSQEVFDADSNTARFVELGASAFSVLDDVAGVLNSVPFVGAALGVTLGVVQTVLQATKSRVSLPPRLLMDPDHDLKVVNRALDMIRGGMDWTPLFLPSGPESLADAGGSERGDWKIVEYEEGGGVTFHRGDSSWITNFGCAPGDLFFVAHDVKSRISTANVTIPRDSAPPHSVVLRTGENPQSLRDLVFSLGEWYPGLAALGRSVWSMIGTAQSAAMFNVDGYRLIGAWSDYHHSLERYREYADSFLGRDLQRGGKGFKRDLIRVYLATVGAAFHDVRTADGNPLNQEQLLELALDANRRPVQETVGRQAARAASVLVERQYEALETPLNALVSKDATAFRDKGLREHLHRERSRLLDAGKFDGVELDEVPDAGLRTAILNRLRTSPESPSFDGPTGLADAGSVARDREQLAQVNWDAAKVRRPLDMTGLGVPVEPDSEGGGSVLALSLLAAAGVGGAAALYLRNRKHRKA